MNIILTAGRNRMCFPEDTAIIIRKSWMWKRCGAAVPYLIGDEEL